MLNLFDKLWLAGPDFQYCEKKNKVCRKGEGNRRWNLDEISWTKTIDPATDRRELVFIFRTFDNGYFVPCRNLRIKYRRVLLFRMPEEGLPTTIEEDEYPIEDHEQNLDKVPRNARFFVRLRNDQREYALCQWQDGKLSRSSNDVRKFIDTMMSGGYSRILKNWPVTNVVGIPSPAGVTPVIYQPTMDRNNIVIRRKKNKLEKQLKDVNRQIQKGAKDKDVMQLLRAKQKLLNAAIRSVASDNSNFARQIHCLESRKDQNKLEVSIVFNDEVLRANRLLGWIYKTIRRIRDCRVVLTDIETFKIIIDNNGLPTDYIFEGIYSGTDSVKNDSTHKDKKSPFSNDVRKHTIELFLESVNRPIVFVNTSNHALGERDNNQDLWKYEFVVDDKGCLATSGSKSRLGLDSEFTSEAEIIAKIGSILKDKSQLQEDVDIYAKCLCDVRNDYLLNEIKARELVEKAIRIYE